MLQKLNNDWQDAINKVRARFPHCFYYKKDKAKLKAFLSREKIFVGFAGAGGVGKTSSIRKLQKLGFVKVTNTTTRPKRPLEQDGIDYYFVSAKQFEELKKSYAFANYEKKPNKGSYGLQKIHLIENLHYDKLAMDESPEALNRIFTYTAKVDKSRTNFLVYLLPPEPTVENLLKHLGYRHTALNKFEIERHIGARLIDEFLKLLSVSHPKYKLVVCCGYSPSEIASLFK